MFLTTVVAYLMLRKLTAAPAIEDVEENATGSTNAPAETTEEEEEEGTYTYEQFNILKRTGESISRK